jgi:hypothetical protein
MKTAVEWLINELVELDKLLDGRCKNEDDTIFKLPPDKLYERAKQMEKEQIINAHGLRYSDITEETVKGEQYYNQTYNQDRELGKEVTDLLENYKKDKTFKQKSKWTKLYEEVLEKEEEEKDGKEIIIEELRKAVMEMQKEIRLLKNATRPLK